MKYKKDILKKYLDGLDKLYKNIEPWIKSLGLSTTLKKIKLSEENIGEYDAFKLIINNSKDEMIIANVEPVGALIIGANGRVDLIGKYDKIVIVKLEKNKFLENSTTTTTATQKGYSSAFSSTQFYRGITKNGWYWVEDNRRGKAHLLNKELFFELLSEVSGHDFL